MGSRRVNWTEAYLEYFKEIHSFYFENLLTAETSSAAFTTARPRMIHSLPDGDFWFQDITEFRNFHALMSSCLHPTPMPQLICRNVIWIGWPINRECHRMCFHSQTSKTKTKISIITFYEKSTAFMWFYECSCDSYVVLMYHAAIPDRFEWFFCWPSPKSVCRQTRQVEADLLFGETYWWSFRVKKHLHHR